MSQDRYLVVAADDFGIGPATSRGILELAELGVITATVLLVNSPHAEAAVQAWRRSASKVDLGWHPCLTIDKPVLPAERISSLVEADGTFPTLGTMMRKLFLGRARQQEIEDEFRAQYDLFRKMTGTAPMEVNSHHHLQVFSVVGASLRRVLARQTPKPYFRRVREPWKALIRVPGARWKRMFLNHLGRAEARRQEAAGFPGNDWLAGITDPPRVFDPEFFSRWLRLMPGRVVELTCHPGHLDASLIGRDGSFEDGQIHRRPREWELLRMPSFRQAIQDAGFTLARPSQLAGLWEREQSSRPSISA